MELENLGWNAHFKTHYKPFIHRSVQPGRISFRHRNLYEVLYEKGVCLAKIPKKTGHGVNTQTKFPTVGDWVLLAQKTKGSEMLIENILPRKTAISGNEPIHAEDNVLAANVDVLFLVFGLDDENHLRHIEKYLTIAYDSGAMPVILLNKIDRCINADEKKADVESVAFGLPIHLLSAISSQGVESLSPYFRNGATGAFLGASGAGKSTIINKLLGYDLQTASENRVSLEKGVHSTIIRELLPLSSGGLILDNPGLRNMNIPASDLENKETFKDIEEFIRLCRFSDCRHAGEPGCAVIRAIDEGDLKEKSLDAYLRLKRDPHSQKGKRSKKSDIAEKEKWRNIIEMTDKKQKPSKR